VELSRQIVGIDAACSGIESFQASLMASVFLWGAMKLRVRAGLTLLVAGMACSIGINFCRVLILTYLAYVSGGQNQTIHDWVGGAASALIFAAIFLVARSLRDRKPQQESELPLYDAPLRDKKVALAWPGAALFCVGFLSIPLIASFVLGPENQTLLSPEPRWQIDTRHLQSGWIARELEPRGPQRSMLQFSRWTGFQIRTPDGRWANVIHLFWAGDRGIPSMAFYHTPALCMPAVGWQLIREPEPFYLEAGGESVPFVSYLLSQDAERVLVLQYLVRGQRTDPFLIDSMINGDRLGRLAELRRNSR
jgi:exosortase/archaeosortase family protein